MDIVLYEKRLLVLSLGIVELIERSSGSMKV